MASSKRRLLLCVGSTLLTFVLLEVGLQVLALVVWLRAAPPSETVRARDDGRQVVMCTGDSFTFGMGASTPDHAYPGQLEALLRGRGLATVDVVNVGKPGRDSRELVQELDGWLERGRPDILCVLIGINDSWRHSGRADPAATPNAGGFVWRWRTRDLVALLLRGGGLFDDRASAPTDHHPLVGQWQLVGSEVGVEFTADGSCTVGLARMHWEVRGDGLAFGPPGAEVAATYRVEGAGVVFQPAGQPPMLLLRVPDDVGAADARRRRLTFAFHAAVAADDKAQIATIGKELLDVLGDDVTLRLLVLPSLAIAERMNGQRASSDARLVELRALTDAAPDDVERLLARLSALRGVGEYAPAIQLAEQRLANATVASPKLIAMHAQLVAEALDRPRAMAVIDRALSTLAADGPERQALLVLRSRTVESGDVDGIVGALLELFAAGDLPESTVRAALGTGRILEIPDAEIEAVGHRSGTDPKVVERLIAMRREHVATLDPADWRDVLREHLARIAARCEKDGIRLVLGTYPFEHPDVQRVLRTSAAELRVPLAEMKPRFPTDAAERAKLLVADGHCNDAGYAQMAAAFADVIEPLLRPR